MLPYTFYRAVPAVPQPPIDVPMTPGRCYYVLPDNHIALIHAVFLGQVERYGPLLFRERHGAHPNVRSGGYQLLSSNQIEDVQPVECAEPVRPDATLWDQLAREPDEMLVRLRNLLAIAPPDPGIIRRILIGWRGGIDAP